MGIILPQTVTVRIYERNCNYYRNLGYDIPNNKKSYIDVNVQDLPPQSEYKVYCTCDDCNKILYKSYYNYQRSLNTYGACYCINCVHKGERSYMWKSELSDENRVKGRDYTEYNQFINRVLIRDHYICQRCGAKNVKLEVHHMDGYNWCIPRRTDDTNGITLCSDCHKAFHSKYGKKDNTQAQFEEWFNKPVEFDKFTGEIHTLPRVYCLENEKIYNDRNEVAKEIGCHPLSVRLNCKGICFSLYGRHFVYYDDFLKGTMPEKVVNDFKNNRVKPKNRIEYPIDTRELKNIDKVPIRESAKDGVLCLNDGQLYNFAVDQVPYDIKDHRKIYQVCNGSKRTTGNLQDKYIDWFWPKDFNRLPLYDQIKLAEQNKDTIIKDSFLYNLLKKYNVV